MFCIAAYELAKRLGVLYEANIVQLQTAGMEPHELRDWFAAEFDAVLKRLGVEGNAITTSAEDIVKTDRPPIDAAAEADAITDEKFKESTRVGAARAREFYRSLRKRGQSCRQAALRVVDGVAESCEAVRAEE